MSMASRFNPLRPELSFKVLKNLRFEGYVALPLRPTPRSQQESGHPTPRREWAKQRGKAKG